MPSAPGRPGSLHSARISGPHDPASKLVPRACAQALALRVARIAAALLLIFCAAHERAAAQDLDEITISGRVADQNGAVILGARVVATLTATGASRESKTGAEGRYRFVELSPGAYTLRVSAEGFAPEERANVSALAGQNVRLDFTLRPAGVAAGQTVSAAGESAIDTTRTVVGGTVAAREIERLPVFTRSPLDLVFTLPGVTEEPLTTLYF